MEFSCTLVVRESAKVIRIFDGRHDYFRGNRVFIPDTIKKGDIPMAVEAALRSQLNIGNRPMRILSVRPQASVVHAGNTGDAT